MAARRRFHGRIAGVGSTSGVRIVVGRWDRSPWGEFADAMVERPDGHRLLLAPSDVVAGLVSTTYTFDAVRIEPVVLSTGSGTADGSGRGDGGDTEAVGVPDVPVARPSWVLRAPSLSLDLVIGHRTGLGRLLRLVPGPVAASPAFATLVDPVARLALDGVRTRGTARAGRREYYGATDMRAVTAAWGAFDGTPLGALAPVDPPCRFGFTSTPRRPSVTDVVTTIVDVG